MISDSDISDYERLRLANIERNNRYLQVLGLEGGAGVLGSHSRPGKTKTKSVLKLPSDLVRRSARLAAAESVPVYTEVSVPVNRLPNAERNEPRELDGETTSAEILTHQRKRKSSVALPREISPDSSRAIDADLSFLLGDGLGGYVGENRTKAAVMAIANHGRVPSFSKYSGIAEWRNCLFLWVNYADPKNEMQNEFSNKGRNINWYGGSTLHRDSEIIQKLIRFCDETQNVDSINGKCVLMFLRRPDELYVSLGRLKYASYDLDAHPVTFVFELFDYERLQRSKRFLEVTSS